MAKTNNKTGTIQSGNFHLRYCIEGEGPAVIVIGSTIYYPRTFSQDLRKNLRLAFIDRRGFSEKPNNLNSNEFTLDTILDDIEKIRKELNFSRIILLGHSGHGYMAIEYAKKYPESVSHLILLAMSPDSSSKSYAAADRYFLESVCPERKELLAKNLATVRSDFNDLTVRVFEKSGHTPQLEESELFDNELLQWLSSRKSTND